MHRTQIFTYTARVPSHPLLDAAAELVSTVEHELHQHLARGGALDQATKSRVAEERGLPGRWYNGVVTTLEGKHDGIRALRETEMENLAERIAQVEKAIRRIASERLPKALALKDEAARRKKVASLRLSRHGKKRKLGRLRARLARFQAEMARPVPSLCFGTKKLFRAQFNLRANRYRNHGEWLSEWRAARASVFMIPGSLDEASGNKTCRSRVEEDGSITLTIAVPEGLQAAYGKTVVLAGIWFGYGHEETVSAIQAANEAAPAAMAYQRETAALVARLRDANGQLSAEGLAEAEKALRKERTSAAKAARAGLTTAITWRFVRDGKGWRVAVSVNRRLEVSGFGFAHGALGLDLNVGFVSLTPVDGSGNPLKRLMTDLPFDASALCSDRAKARMGEVVKTIVAMAIEQRRPIVIEKLDFQKKKAALKDTAGPTLARKLSSFAYTQFRTMLHARAMRSGVRVLEVNPKYTSHMGRAKYARPLGISVHAAAAAMIARRGMRLSEGLFATAEIPLGDGSHVTLKPPVRMDRRHVWKSWGAHFGRFKAARKVRAAAAKAGRTRRGEGGNPRSRPRHDVGSTLPATLAGSRPPRSPRTARGTAAHKAEKRHHHGGPVTQVRPDDQV